jgi:hypothetical protein
MLIKAYIFIFLDVIFAPFWIIGGILPGAPGGVGPWLRSLISNLAAFPVVMVLFMIGKTIQDQASHSHGYFVPPLVGNPGDASGIASILGLGIILIMPEALNMTKSMLKAPENKYLSSVGRQIGAGSSAVQSVGKHAKSSLWYTNPRTGEAGRLKAFVGQKVQNKLDNMPVVGKFSQRIRQAMPKSPSEEREKQARETAEARDEIRQHVVPPSKGTPVAGTTPPLPTAAEIKAKAQDLAKQSGWIADPAEYDKLPETKKKGAESLASRWLRRERGIEEE